MSTFDWPCTLVPLNINIKPPRLTMGLTTSISEFSQVTPAIRPPFGMTIEFDQLFGDDMLAYRALLASFEGRANTVRIPLFDLAFAASDAAIGARLVGFTDGGSFTDGSAFITSDLVGVTVTSVQGSRTITADFGAYGQLLEAGQYFGLGDYPYIAKYVSWAGSVATIRFSPSIRVDYEDEPLRLRPVMIAGLSGDDIGEHNLNGGRYGAPTLDLVERFDEPLS